MKTAILRQLLTLLLVFMAGNLIAQPPAIPIQSVAKDNNGNPAKLRRVYVKIAIRHSQINGTIVWEEAFETTTNEDGVYTVSIGMGTKDPRITINSIADIAWGNGPYFVNHKLAVAPSIPASWWIPIDNYVDLGTTQMASVPYAMYAGNASVTNVTTSLPPGQANTFLVTDSLGNVKWAPPQAANVNVTNITNLNLAIRTGQNVSIKPNTTSVVEVEVAGVLPGDPILVTPQGDYENWSVYAAWVFEPGKVKIRFANYTDTEVDVKGSEYKIVVIK